MFYITLYLDLNCAQFLLYIYLRWVQGWIIYDLFNNIQSKEESMGNPYKVKLFKKFDGIAKRLPKHRLFRRYNDEDLPYFILFDCGSTTDPSSESVCKQIVGENIPNILIFRPQQQPRALPTEYKSDSSIITYLYNLMQPAVKYLDELISAEDFVADDSELHTVLFSSPKHIEAIKVYDEVCDIM